MGVLCREDSLLTGADPACKSGVLKISTGGFVVDGSHEAFLGWALRLTLIAGAPARGDNVLSNVFAGGCRGDPPVLTQTVGLAELGSGNYEGSERSKQ
ncbi:hypothetical protein NDU88_002738 [Pleurodeles waltl]|uniref:Uncharacterized protein n=1 Tax=Pleurodeles waltl TaxID=8319 RepID=A0AAV7MNL8_PLEWA|nr:hypothetical protein NDU88_002738 [Pleurodeles waltl]